MRRMAIALEDIAARDNLALAAWKAARGKQHRPAVARFLLDQDERLSALAADILNEQAPRGEQRQFVIHDPKRRTITAACFEDRVLHHAVMNRAESRFEQTLTEVAFACRPGRGVHAAVQAVQRGVQCHAWLVQVDVAGYFPSIRHAILRAQLARRFKGAGFLALLDRIIEAGAPPGAGVGLPIGALTSQHFANAYLDSADRLLLAHPGVGATVRYMDDLVWFCASREAAQESLAQLREHVSEHLALRLKPGAAVRPCAHGLQFCGFRVRPGVILPGARKMARYRQAVQRVVGAEAAGMPAMQLQRAHDGSLAAPAPAQSLHFRRSLWARVFAAEPDLL